MRHRIKVKKVGRPTSARKLMIAGLSSSLIVNEYVVTSLAKAKVCRSFTDKVIYMSRDQSQSSRRRVESLLRDKVAVDKLFNVLVKRFKDRIGGYTTLVRLGRRKGDNTEMAKVILIGSKPLREKKKVRVKKKKAVKKDKKKEKDEGKKKLGVLDRVKEIRGRLMKRREREDQKGEGQLDKVKKKVETKTRSGI